MSVTRRDAISAGFVTAAAGMSGAEEPVSQTKAMPSVTTEEIMHRIQLGYQTTSSSFPTTDINALGVSLDASAYKAPGRSASRNVERLLSYVIDLQATLESIIIDWHSLTLARLGIANEKEGLLSLYSRQLQHAKSALIADNESLDNKKNSTTAEGTYREKEKTRISTLQNTFFAPAKWEELQEVTSVLGRIAAWPYDKEPNAIETSWGHHNVRESSGYFSTRRAKRDFDMIDADYRMQLDALSAQGNLTQELLTSLHKQQVGNAARIQEIDEKSALAEARHGILEDESKAKNSSGLPGVLNYDERIKYNVKRYRTISQRIDEIFLFLSEAIAVVHGTRIELSSDLDYIMNLLPTLPKEISDAGQEGRRAIADFFLDLARRVQLASYETSRSYVADINVVGSSLAGILIVSLEPDMRRPRLRSIFAWVCPGQGDAVLALRLTPPSSSIVRKMVARLPSLSDLADKGDGTVVVSQISTAPVEIGPVLAPPSSSGKLLVDGPNVNVCPVGNWAIAGTVLNGTTDIKKVRILVTFVYEELAF